MSQTTIALLFLAFAIVSFILEKIPLGLTATICALGLTLTGVLDASTTFAQYVNSNVILCVGMFVVGQALFETGMANKIGGLVTRFARTERTLIIAIMVIVGVMSGFLMAFTMSLDDFIITHFTKGPGVDTLSTKIYTEVKKGIKPEMYALSTLIFMTVLVLLILVNKAPKPREKQ